MDLGTSSTSSNIEKVATDLSEPVSEAYGYEVYFELYLSGHSEGLLYTNFVFQMLSVTCWAL